jgi:hypothetical protein
MRYKELPEIPFDRIVILKHILLTENKAESELIQHIL